MALQGQFLLVRGFYPHEPNVITAAHTSAARLYKLVPHIVPTFADPINKQQMFQHLPYLGATPPHGRRLARGNAPAGCGAEPREEKFGHLGPSLIRGIGRNGNFHHRGAGFRRALLVLILAAPAPPAALLMVRHYVKKGGHGGDRGGGLPQAFWYNQGGRAAAGVAKAQRKAKAAAEKKNAVDEASKRWKAMVDASKNVHSAHLEQPDAFGAA